MKKFAFVLIVGLAFSVHAAKEEHISKVETIFKRYLDTPHPKGPSKTDAYDRQMDKKTNRARLDRLAILAELKAFPTESVLVARRVLFEQADPKQRHEIVGRLGEIHTRECAELLRDVIQNVRKPKDEDEALYEELVRSSAVQGLRTMGGRTVRTGGNKRIQQGADFEPKVPGLVPYMISAADDPAERVRISALYALADSREPTAVAELRNRLKDPSNKVRLYAACFLTEYQDAAGLTEMRKALDRLRKTDVGHDFDFYWNIEMLLASFERITGKSFGDIPLNPMLSGYSPPPGKKRYKELLDIWHTWWNWKPDG